MAYEKITMAAGGREFEGWTSVSVVAEWGAATRTFEIVVTEIGGFANGGVTKWHFPPSTPVSLYANGSLLLTGSVDKYNPQIGPQEHTVTIRGRGTGMGIVDCSVKHPTGQFENKTILQIAQELSGPFGVTISALSSAADVAARVVPWFQVQRGATVWSQIMRLLPQIGATLTGQADGSVAIMRCEPKEHPGGLTEGENILQASADWDDSGRFEDYEVTGQSSIGTEDENFEVSGEASGASMGQYRYTETIDQAETDAGRAREHATWQMLRAAGLCRQAEITVPGFRDGAGALWEPGQTVFTFSPSLKLEQPMMIKTANFVQSSEEGTVTHLTLVDPRTGGGAGGDYDGGGWDVFEGHGGAR